MSTKQSEIKQLLEFRRVADEIPPWVPVIIYTGLDFEIATYSPGVGGAIGGWRKGQGLTPRVTPAEPSDLWAPLDHFGMGEAYRKSEVER